MRKPKLSSDQKLDQLGSHIRTWNLLVALLILIPVCIYVAWFGGFNSGSISKDAEAWGQFGDYMGGMLNPLVAFAAFYWLTQTVKLQKEELIETQKALADSAKSQAKQATYAQVSVRIAALTALIDAIRLKINTLEEQAERNLVKINPHPCSKCGYGGEETFKEFVKKRNQIEFNLNTLIIECEKYEMQLKELLAIYKIPEELNTEAS